MSLGAAGRMRSELCTALVCIDSFGDYNMTGRLYHNSLPHELYFRSFMELIEQMEHIFNSLDYPQTSMSLRSFEGTAPVERDDVKASAIPLVHALTARGEVATFRIRVMFRQNASWQGSIDWVEQEKQENFRSVLELLHLIDSAIPCHEKNTEQKSNSVAM